MASEHNRLTVSIFAGKFYKMDCIPDRPGAFEAPGLFLSQYFCFFLWQTPFDFRLVLIPVNTKGNLSIRAFIPGSTIDEVNLNNNADAEKIDYSSK